MGYFCPKSALEIIWNNLQSKSALPHEDRVNLEYAVRLQVVKILIKEAEHLMDYLSLISVEINLENGFVSVSDETPEPLFSMIANNLVQPKIKEIKNFSNSIASSVIHV
ncbi:MAG: hypothetical protein CMH46_18200 [Muricauda sp.]|nr:hypothetical protein [Allomuricauda sp.]MAU17463.1 hypothetical protein [Allomuricauda sp.]